MKDPALPDYEPPIIEEVPLRPEEMVLAACKTASPGLIGRHGPAIPCGPAAPCNAPSGS